MEGGLACRQGKKAEEDFKKEPLCPMTQGEKFLPYYRLLQYGRININETEFESLRVFEL